MGIGYYNSLVTMQAAGPTVTAAARTSLLNPQAKLLLPAGFFAYIGQKLKIVAQGQLSNVVTTPGTILLDIGVGATGTTVVLSSGNLGMSAIAHTTLPIWFEADLTVRSLGTSATFMPQGRVTGKPFNTVAAAAADTIGSETTLMIPGTTPATTTFDSTIANLVDFACTFSLTTAAITIQQYEVISCNWGG